MSQHTTPPPPDWDRGLNGCGAWKPDYLACGIRVCFRPHPHPGRRHRFALDFRAMADSIKPDGVYTAADELDCSLEGLAWLIGRYTYGLEP